MDKNNVILRNEAADYLSHKVVESVFDSVHCEDMLEWHRVRLNRVYVSSNDKIEVDVTLDRGWDTKMSFEIESNPDESVDRLTDQLYNNIKQTVRKTCEEQFDIDFDNNEKIKSLRIRQRTGEYSNNQDPTYVAEFDTKNHEDTIIIDHKMSGSPRICGRRILVSWIWSNHVRKDMDAEEISETYDGSVTEDEVEKAIQFAEKSDEFESRAEIDDTDDGSDGEFLSVDELKAELSNQNEEDRLDVEDNR